MEEIGLNQQYFLAEKIIGKYPKTFATYSEPLSTVAHKLKGLEPKKYKFLLALYYNQKNAELDAELSKLGILS
jgi:hypothetical protein